MTNNFGSWPDDDDNDGAGLTDEFCAQIDSIVEHHNKNATQAGPIQGSSQVLASLVSPGPHPISTAPPAQAQPLVHPKYGEVKRPNYGQSSRPRAYHNYQSANQYNRGAAPFGASVNNWNQTVKPSNSLRPPFGNVSTPHSRGHQGSGGSWRPTSSLGVFGDSPSPAGPSWPQAEGYFGTSMHQAQTLAMQNGGAQLHYRPNPSNVGAQQTAAHRPLADPRPSSGGQGANSNHQLPMPATGYRPAGGAPVTDQQLPWNVKPTIAPPEPSQPPVKSQRLRDKYGKRSSQPLANSQPASIDIPASLTGRGNLGNSDAPPNRGPDLLLQAQLDGLPEDAEPPYVPTPVPEGAQAGLLRDHQSAMEDLKRQLEQAVRDKLDLQRRLSQHSASTSMPAAFNPADLARQLEQTNQQMVFKEQELVEARQKHADVLDSLRGAEEEAKRLRAEFSKSEALRTKLALGVQQAQASRQALEEAPLATQGAGVKRKKLSEAVADCNVVVQLQPSPPQAPEEAQVRSEPIPEKVETRSTGTNPLAFVDQNAALDPWEVPWFPMRFTGSVLWRDLWVTCGSSASALTNQQSLPTDLDPSIDWAALQSARDLIHSQVNLIAVVGEEACPALLLLLANFLHSFGCPLLRLTGRQHAESHLWIAQLASSLHLLSALLSCSPQCLQVAGGMHSSDHISDSSRDILSSNLTENLSRVSLHSKGVLLRPLLRLKDRPPDGSVATELRNLGGVMQILVALQTTVNQQSMESLDVQQALLSSFDTLLSSKLTESAGVLLCRSGCLDHVVRLENRELLPKLLSIAQRVMSKSLCCDLLLQACLQKATQSSTQIALSNTRTSAYALLDVPLLCFQSDVGAEEVLASGRVTEGLIVLVELLEHALWKPLRYLLSDHADRDCGPPLSQRILLVADRLFHHIRGLEVDLGERSIAAEYWTALATLQECLLFLRCLFGEVACALAVADDLISTSSSQRTCLALTSFLADWPGLDVDLADHCQLIKGTHLAPWVKSMGTKYTGRPFYAHAEPGAFADVQEIAYLAKSIRRRVLHQLEHAD